MLVPPGPEVLVAVVELLDCVLDWLLVWPTARPDRAKERSRIPRIFICSPSGAVLLDAAGEAGRFAGTDAAHVRVLQ